MAHLGSPFKDTVMVGQHTSATGAFAARGRSSDKSKAVLMFDLSMATIFDPTDSTLQTFVFYTNPPNDNSLLHRLVKQAHRRYISRIPPAPVVPARPSPDLEIIPSSVPSSISSSPPPSAPSTLSLPPPRQPSELLETLPRSSPRLRRLKEGREALTKQPRRAPSAGVVVALLSRRLAEARTPCQASPATKAPSTKRTKSKKAAASAAHKKAKPRSKASGKAKKAVTKAAPRAMALLRSAVQRGKLRTGLLI